VPVATRNGAKSRGSQTDANRDASCPNVASGRQWYERPRNRLTAVVNRISGKKLPRQPRRISLSGPRQVVNRPPVGQKSGSRKSRLIRNDKRALLRRSGRDSRRSQSRCRLIVPNPKVVTGCRSAKFITSREKSRRCAQLSAGESRRAGRPASTHYHKHVPARMPLFLQPAQTCITCLATAWQSPSRPGTSSDGGLVATSNAESGWICCPSRTPRNRLAPESVPRRDPC
jgi:hypothetical protein